jgi:DNA modification methylase
VGKSMNTEAANSKKTKEKLLKTKRKLAIEYRSIATLRLDAKNPRLHNEKQIRQIARSIEAFGFNVPILINAKMQVVAGHGRLRACKLLGLTEAPTIRLEHLTDAQARAFMIADNRLTENSVWDERLLGEQFKALSMLELDFSIDVTGFEMGEIDVMIEGLAPASRGKEDPADAIPDSGAKPQVTQAGDLWGLDRHRVHCGDARNEANYSVLMQGRRASAVFSGPPYNDPIDGYVAGFGKIHHAEFAMASGEMSAAEFTAFLAEVLTLLARHSADGALQFICMDWRHTPELLAAARQAYSEFKNLCIWVKDVAGQGSLYRSQHELVFVFKSGKRAHRNNIQLGQFGRCRTNVWQYRRVNSLARTIDESNLSDLHPTIKPVELIADAILDCTARGDVVLDAFLGSGTTVVAAERTGRVCYGIELDPRYVDTIVRRWQAFTGQSAIQESTGRTFNEIEEEKNGRAE